MPASGGRPSGWPWRKPFAARLHSLGLGENPPTSDYITSRVMECCP